MRPRSLLPTHSLADLVRLYHPRARTAWLFELAGGAIADFDGTCVPKSQREAAFTIAGLHQWDMGIDDPRCVETAEEVRCAPFSPPASASH